MSVIGLFDIGASRTRLALAEDGKLGRVAITETDGSAGGFGRFLGLLEELGGGRRLAAVVGGLPGQVAGNEGRVVQVRNLPDWKGIEIKQRIGQLLDCPVYITNDVLLGGLGEAHEGAGSARGVMAYVTVSTGVNLVRLVDGVIDKTIGRYEVGEQLIGWGSDGWQTLEQRVGGAALTKRTGRAPSEVKDPAVWRQMEEDLAVGLYNAVVYWWPELIVLGGSMMRDIDVRVVQKKLELLAEPDWPRVPRLVRASLGDVAGLHGAMAWYNQIRQ